MSAMVPASAAALGGRVYKVSGAGNDFVALIEPQRDPTAGEMRAWCARGFALGADGVFVLRRDGTVCGWITGTATADEPSSVSTAPAARRGWPSISAGPSARSRSRPAPVR